MKNELNTDNLDSNNEGDKEDPDGISSIEELWDKLLDDNKAEEDRLISKLDFTPSNEVEMQDMLRKIKDKIEVDQN